MGQRPLVDDFIDAIDAGDDAAALAILEAHPQVAEQESSREGKLGGATALHWAAHRNALHICSRLVELGADVNARRARWWRTPLAWAADGGHVATVAFLLENGAEANADAYGKTSALHAVAQGGSTCGARDPEGYGEVARLLIRHGVDIDRATDYDGATALDDAVRKGNHPVEAVLREAVLREAGDAS